MKLLRVMDLWSGADVIYDIQIKPGERFYSVTARLKPGACISCACCEMKTTYTVETDGSQL